MVVEWFLLVKYELTNLSKQNRYKYLQIIAYTVCGTIEFTNKN